MAIQANYGERQARPREKTQRQRKASLQRELQLRKKNIAQSIVLVGETETRRWSSGQYTRPIPVRSPH